MEFYNTDSNRVSIPNEVLNNEVKNDKWSTSYQWKEDLYLKIYKNETDPIYRLDSNIYKVLKDTKSDNLIDIVELLYSKKDTRSESTAYLARYPEETYSDFLEVSSEYILANIDEILKLSNELGKQRIRLYDLKRETIALTDSRIILTTPDSWKHSHLHENNIINLNINALSFLFNTLTRESLLNNHKDFIKNSSLYSTIFSDKLFPITTNPNKTMKVLTKKLKGYNKPIDCIYDMKK